MLNLLIVNIVVALFFYILLRRQRRQADIRGWVVDQDLDGKGKRVYRDSQTGISCKPDVVERKRLIEYKSAPIKGKARYSDILQVAAQMMATGKTEAELRYAKGAKFSFKKGSRVMRGAIKEVEGIVRKMRWHLLSRIAPKGAPTPNKCRGCTVRKECPDASPC